jgi:hypothetical protein
MTSCNRPVAPRRIPGTGSPSEDGPFPDFFVEPQLRRGSMRKVVFAINITTDGYCSHTDMIADDEMHE